MSRRRISHFQHNFTIQFVLRINQFSFRSSGLSKFPSYRAPRREKRFPRSRVSQIFRSISDRAFASEKVEVQQFHPRRMSLVCAVGLREQEGTAIRALAESRFRSEGHNAGNRCSNEQKERLMSRRLGHSSRRPGKLFAIFDKCRLNVRVYAKRGAENTSSFVLETLMEGVRRKENG